MQDFSNASSQGLFTCVFLSGPLSKPVRPIYRVVCLSFRGGRTCVGQLSQNVVSLGMNGLEADRMLSKKDTKGAVGVAQWVGSLSSMLKALSSSPAPHELSVVGKATISGGSGGRRGRSSVSSLSTEGTQAWRKLRVKGRRRDYIKEDRETVCLSFTGTESPVFNPVEFSRGEKGILLSSLHLRTNLEREEHEAAAQKGGSGGSMSFQISGTLFPSAKKDQLLPSSFSRHNPQSLVSWPYPL